MIEINSVVAEMSSVYHLENWMDDKAYHNAKALLKIYSCYETVFSAVA